MKVTIDLGHDVYHAMKDFFDAFKELNENNKDASFEDFIKLLTFRGYKQFYSYYMGERVDNIDEDENEIDEKNIDIFKVQRPLSSSHDDEYSTMYLVYNEHKFTQAMVAPKEHIVKHFKNNEPKIYVKGTLIDGELTIIEKLEEHPNW